VRFWQTAQLVQQLGKAKREGTLDRLPAGMGKARLLVLDEFGYVPFDVDGARLLYQVISESYERRSAAFTTSVGDDPLRAGDGPERQEPPRQRQPRPPRRGPGGHGEPQPAARALVLPRPARHRAAPAVAAPRARPAAGEAQAHERLLARPPVPVPRDPGHPRARARHAAPPLSRIRRPAEAIVLYRSYLLLYVNSGAMSSKIEYCCLIVARIPQPR
jgi:hypothetical protein